MVAPNGQTMEGERPKIEILREAFITTQERPTYDELAEKFGVPRGTVGKWAADESWPALRMARQDAMLREADAKDVLLEVVNCDRAMLRKVASLAINSLDKLTAIVDAINDEMAVTTRANTMNTCMFGFANLAKGLHECGMLGASKTLEKMGKEDNGRWNPEMLQQINVTVQNLTQQAAQVKDALAPSKQAPAIVEEMG